MARHRGSTLVGTTKGTSHQWAGSCVVNGGHALVSSLATVVIEWGRLNFGVFVIFLKIQHSATQKCFLLVNTIFDARWTIISVKVVFVA